MKTKVVKPTPYFEISMECSNRKFYGIQDKLWDLCCEIDPDQDEDLWNGYRIEKCDYEGDLDFVKICNCEETKDWINLIIKSFEIKECIPEGMDIVFKP